MKLGDQTNSQRKRDRTYKTKEIDMKGKTWVKDNSYPVNTWVLKKKSKLKTNNNNENSN